MNNTPDKETHDTAKIESLSKFRILSNLLLCKVIPYPKTTKLGITISALDENQYIAQNTNRVFEVIKLPETLRFHGSMRSISRPMRWKTDIDLQVGDIIWVTADEAVNCQNIIIGDETYSMIHYDMIRAAKRDGKVISVNGFIICEEVKYEEKCLEYTVEKVNDNELKVLYPAKPNEYYVMEYKKGVFTYKYDDHFMKIKKGDILIKANVRMGSMGGKLEDDMHRTFEGDKVVICIQSRHIGGLRYGI